MKNIYIIININVNIFDKSHVCQNIMHTKILSVVDKPLDNNKYAKCIVLDGCVIEVTVNPLYPNYCPKFDFHGQPDAIDKFQHQLNQINPVIIINFSSIFILYL